MRARLESCDALFATTAGAEYLRPFVTGRNVVAYMPNPADTALETLDNSTRPAEDFACDLFYAGQPREGDPRLDFIRRLKEAWEGQPLARDHASPRCQSAAAWPPTPLAGGG